MSKPRHLSHTRNPQGRRRFVQRCRVVYNGRKTRNNTGTGNLNDITSCKGIFCSMKQIKCICKCQSFESHPRHNVKWGKWDPELYLENDAIICCLFYSRYSPIHSLPFSHLLCAPGGQPLKITKSEFPCWLNPSCWGQWKALAIDQRVEWERSGGISSLWSLPACSDVTGLCSGQGCRYRESRTWGPLSFDVPTSYHTKHIKIYTLLTISIILAINFWRGLYKFHNSDPRSRSCIWFIGFRV